MPCETLIRSTSELFLDDFLGCSMQLPPDNPQQRLSIIKQLPAWASLTESGRALLERVRNSEPDRRVRGGGGNWSGRFPSRKMGRIVQWESRSIARCRVIALEFSPSVLEYYDETLSVGFTYENHEGRRVGCHPTLDYFVIERDFIGFEECRPDDVMELLAAKHPRRYSGSRETGWDSPPLRAALAEFGLGFRIITPAILPRTAVRNADFLREYLENPAKDVSAGVVTTMHELIRTQHGIPLATALAQFTNADDFYWGLLARHWYVDLGSELLSKYDSTRVYLSAKHRTEILALEAASGPVRNAPDSSTPRIGDKIVLATGVFRVIEADECVVFLQGGTLGDIQNVDASSLVRLIDTGRAQIQRTEHDPRFLERSATDWMKANEGDQKSALARLAVLKDFWKTGKTPSDIAERTVRHWDLRYQEGMRSHGNGLVALLPRTSRKGNRTSRISEEEEQFLKQFLDREFERPLPPRKGALYAVYVAEAKTAGIFPVGRQAFDRRLARRDEYGDTLASAGKKRAYQVQPAKPARDVHEPPEGDRAFQLAHIDHTQLDLFVRLTNRATLCARPWLTLVIDAYTRLILGFWIGFQTPNQDSCAMALRDVLRRQRRLPAALVHDWGKEFGSTFFEILLADQGIESYARPPGEPRFGNPVERMGGNINQWLCKLVIGSNELLKEPRSTSSTHDPRILSAQTLPSVAEKLEQVLFKYYENRTHSRLGCTPREKMQESLLVHGRREHLNVLDPGFFTTITLCNARRHRGSVDPRTGIRVNGWDYYHDDFRSAHGEKLSERPLYDMEDPRYVFAKFRGQLLRCDLIGSQAARLTGNDLRFACTEHLFELSAIGAERIRDLERKGAMILELRRDEFGNQDRRSVEQSVSSPEHEDASPKSRDPFLGGDYDQIPTAPLV